MNRRNTTIGRGLLAVTLLGLGLFGCNHANANDPMSIVKSDTADSKIDAQYWLDVHKNNPKVFDEALAYCKPHYSTKPNCQTMVDTAHYNLGIHVWGG